MPKLRNSRRRPVQGFMLVLCAISVGTSTPKLAVDHASQQPTKPHGVTTQLNDGVNIPPTSTPKLMTDHASTQPRKSMPLTTKWPNIIDKPRLSKVLSEQVVRSSSPKFKIDDSSNNPTKGGSVTTQNTDTVNNQPISMAQRMNCALIPTDENIYHEIQKSLDDGMTMLEYEMKLEDEHQLDVMSPNTNHALFQPLFWVRYIGRFSSRLLLLKPNYDVMSFQILDIGVRKFTNITLREEPKGCLSTIGLLEFEVIVRELVMADFNIVHTVADSEEHKETVCNMHVVNDADWAEFKYYCCKYEEHSNVTCQYLEHDFYLDLMRVIIRVFKVLFVLMCPALLPVRFYGLNRKKKQYKYKLAKPFRVFVRLQQNNVINVNENIVNIEEATLDKMGEFKKTIQNHRDDLVDGQVYEVEEAELKIQPYKLIESGHAPANIFDTLYRSLILCKIRDMASFKDCCNTSIWPERFGCTYTWRRFCKSIGGVIYTLALITPWVVRLVIYYVFERDEIETRKQAAKDNHLWFKFPGNLTMLLTPVHALFIIIYTVIAIEGLIFGKLNRKIVRDLQFVFKHCFRDMVKERKTKTASYVIRMLLLPFHQLGVLVFIFGPFLWIVYIPIAILALLFYTFPTINITARLLYNLIALCACGSMKPCTPETGPVEQGLCNNTKSFSSIVRALKPKNVCDIELHNKVVKRKGDHGETKMCVYIGSIVLQGLVIIITTFTLYSCIILLTEFAVFLVDFVVYTLIGCILYANYTMTYISLLVLTMLYAKDAYGTVSQKYRDFSATLNKYIFKLCEDRLTPLFYLPEEDQHSTAFRLDPCETVKDTKECICADILSPKVTLIKNEETGKSPSWRIPNLLLFLKKDDVPMIPKNFLFYASENMDYVNKPGRRLHGYLKATWSFFVIVVFLLFVVLVVITFGETTKLSATNKLLATIAGGIVPFLLRNLVFRRFKVDEINPVEDLKFRVAFHDLLKEMDEKASDDNTVGEVASITDWPLYDLTLRKPEKEINRSDADVEVVVEYENKKTESMFNFEAGSSAESMV